MDKQTQWRCLQCGGDLKEIYYYTIKRKDGSLDSYYSTDQLTNYFNKKINYECQNCTKVFENAVLKKF